LVQAKGKLEETAGELTTAVSGYEQVNFVLKIPTD
jgi:hypothetical protein